MKILHGVPGKVFCICFDWLINYSFEKRKRTGFAIRSQSLAEMMMECLMEPALKATLLVHSPTA